MSWRVAESLEQLLAQVNSLAPNRDKSSDGAIGDAEHASRSSDHNPWVKDGSIGVVTARDFTNDPAHGMSSQKLADALAASRDGRIKYIISNRQIMSGAGQDHPAWLWRPYDGINPHDHHCHVSVKQDKAHYDSTQPWVIAMAPQTDEQKKPPPIGTVVHHVLRKGSKGAEVIDLQNLLNAKGVKLNVDGDFGPATEGAVKAYQTAHKLLADGIVGSYTWKALEA